MTELNYNDFFTIKIVRVQDEGKPSHWESEITDNTGEVCQEATCPTFNGLFDYVLNYFMDDEWHEFDANYKPCSDCDDTGWVEKQIDVDAFKSVPCSCGLGDPE
jgi:hypothetical protein